MAMQPKRCMVAWVALHKKGHAIQGWLGRVPTMLMQAIQPCNPWGGLLTRGLSAQSNSICTRTFCQGPP
eukprot:6134671-Amphidinium_carterae.2